MKIEREINGTSYSAVTLPLTQWAELTEFLAGFLGEPFASLLKGDASVSPDQKVEDVGDFQYIIGSIASKLSAKSMLKMAGFMGLCLHADLRPLGAKKQETWWQDHMRDLVPATKLFLEAQYLDFYEGLSDSIPQTTAE